MAMDKEQLLNYFTTHYLSRREVLFKLPLNVSIGTFWPELLNRRKTNATILPLSDGSGKPYWFVLTDKMIEASERLCEEAMMQETQADPYRAAMTTAMTEEVFFTSFVEGAQISKADAIGFLNRGTEPENVGEQMIANNSKAVSAMLRSLYRPIDEQYVKGMAFLLTEDMNNCAEGYRQEDYHPIAAMTDEPYIVPTAGVLPERMNDFYAFLQSPDVHPLIKAAAGQAYILTTRPFSEGNERLSRMISLAILLRSGYDFFRDISVSAMIARENFRYYKSMCEIIRSENGGDLTYFMEYYLTMLVQALDLKKERERKKQQEAIEKEQELARQPLKKPESEVTATIPMAAAENPASEAVSDGIQQTGIVAVTENISDTDMKEDDTVGQSSEQPEPKESPPSLEGAICAFESSRYHTVRELAERMRRAVKENVISFTVRDWSEMHGISLSRSRSDCILMEQYGVVICERGSQYCTYTLIDPDHIVKMKNHSPSVELPDIPSDNPEKEEIGRDISVVLKEMLGDGYTEREQRAARILQKMLDDGITSFRNMDWRMIADTNHNSADNSLCYAVNRGLVRADNCDGKYVCYRICKKVSDGINSQGLTKEQREFMGQIYQIFGTDSFTAKECIAKLNQGESFASSQLKRFTERKLITIGQFGKKENHYSLAVKPNDYPECFSIQRPTAVSSSFEAAQPSAMIAAGY